MIDLQSRKQEAETLTRRRQELREELMRHFHLPAGARDYDKLERIVDELDELRRKLRICEVEG